MRGLPVVLLLAAIATFVHADDSCYINNSGFTCCDKNLESAMKAGLKGRDLLASADSISRGAESRLGGKFETVVAFDDFAYKSHFKDGKTCKISQNGQVALAWQP